MTCIFCNAGRSIIENEYCFAIFDSSSVSKGHMLMIPKRHCETYFDLTDEEKKAIDDLLKKGKAQLDAKYAPDGYNIGANCGASAGQTIFHCHVHLIPRYIGDAKNPKGGVRGVIPGKQRY